MRRERKRAFRVAKAFAEKVKDEVDRLQECQGKDESGKEPWLAKAIDEGEGFLKDTSDALREWRQLSFQILTPVILATPGLMS